MGTIFSQRFQYASIRVFKNYSNISDKKLSLTTFNDDLGMLESDEHDFLTPTTDEYARKKSKARGKILRLTEKIPKKNTKYFYSSIPDMDERIQINFAYKNPKWDNSFDTTKERHMKRHFQNPFSDIVIQTIERKIKINGDKISIQTFTSNKRRDINWKFFKVHTSLSILTFNIKTGNFIISRIDNSPNKKNKLFRTNSFSSLNSHLKEKNGFINSKKYFIHEKSNVRKEFEDTFDDVAFFKKVSEVLDIGFFVNGEEIYQSIIKKFVEVKKIKTPNDYVHLITKLYPTEKFLKKNDRKLIQSVLDMFGIKSKNLIKILHENPFINLDSVIHFCYLFGKDFHKYINSIHLDWFGILRMDDLNRDSIYENLKMNHKYLKTQYNTFPVTDKEKENMIKIIKSNHNLANKNKRAFRVMINEFSDHFNMMQKLRLYLPDISLNATNVQDFANEHLQYSTLIGQIRKGWTIEYQFNGEMVKEIEKSIKVKLELPPSNPIPFVNLIFTPIILKREEEYREEGQHMHHCVASYADKHKSVIISIRLEDSKERVTCEYDAQTGRILQASSFFNEKPTADFEIAIDELNKRVTPFARKGMFGSTHKKRVPIKINGIEISPEYPLVRLNNELFQEF